MAKCMQTEECNMVIKLAQHIKGPGFLQNQSQITIHNGKSQYNKGLGSVSDGPGRAVFRKTSYHSKSTFTLRTSSEYLFGNADEQP